MLCEFVDKLKRLHLKQQQTEHAIHTADPSSLKLARDVSKLARELVTDIEEGRIVIKDSA